MKKRIKKTLIYLLLVCTIMSFMPAFGSAAAMEEKTIQSTAWNSAKTDPTEEQPEDEPEGLNSDNLFELLWNTLKAIALNLRSLSVDEVLNLPANAMDDVLTYIFAAFKVLGLNIDTLYEKITSLFFFI